jgi:hypothetical protein
MKPTRSRLSLSSKEKRGLCLLSYGPRDRQASNLDLPLSVEPLVANQQDIDSGSHPLQGATNIPHADAAPSIPRSTTKGYEWENRPSRSR